MFGRLASIVAKQLLQGQHVVRIHSWRFDSRARAAVPRERIVGPGSEVGCTRDRGAVDGG